MKKKGEVERKNREKMAGGRNKKKKKKNWKGEVLGLVRWRRKSECEKEREKKEEERKA